MPKLFRRSWERYQNGRAGAISAVLPARTGTDGAIASGTFSAPVKVFTSATASFVAGDVGRKIRLTGTPQSGRYDGMYVIDVVTNGTTVELRHNHNVGSTPASPARFFENGSSISWRIGESCTFTADAAGDIEDFYPGSHIIIEGATNPGNNGVWLISHRTSNQVVTLSKSYIFWRTDFTSALGFFAKDDNVDFVAESSLRWAVTDREPHNSPDAWEMQVQALMDCGWTMYHQRGHNATMLTIGDMVLRSLGETDAAIPGGKSMFLRCILVGFSRTAQAQYSTGALFEWAMYQHWDPTQTSTPTSHPGDGAAHCQFNSLTNWASRTAGTVQAASQGDWSMGDGTVDYGTGLGRNGLPHDSRRRDFTFFGDRDEVFQSLTPSGNTTLGWHMQAGHLKPIGANPNIVTVIAPVTSGSNKDVNVGTVDVAALTPPYAVGDNMTIMGRKTAATREFIETTTIVSFNNTDPNNRLVRLTTLAQGYGNGPDTLKAQMGEDPFPVAMEASAGATYAPRLQNLARLANATGRDYDDTNKGSVAVEVTGLASFNEVDPDRRTGKFGLAPVHIKSTANGEYRGRWRYMWLTDNDALPLGKRLVALNTDVYVAVYAWKAANSDLVFVGPMSKVMAGIR